MIIQIKNAEVWAPEYLGITDVWVFDEKIAYIGILDSFPKQLNVEVIDAQGLMLMPGIIDSHVHIAGAGGEGGPQSRTPELQLSAYYNAGVTSVLGCLGTDGITRTVESVLMKAKALRNEGLSVWINTGSYQVPTPNITGSVARDLALINEVVGVGEIAISDHRSSCPTTAELIRLAAETRVGSMLGGKSGMVNLHMGDAKNPFQPIHNAVAESELKYKQFLPTHCNRNSYIFDDAKSYGKHGYVDITTGAWKYFPDDEIKPSVALKELLDAGVPIEHITMTSDAGGSLPAFDTDGNLCALETGLPNSLLEELRDAVLINQIPVDMALKPFTENPAKIYKLKTKGRIAVGFSADLLLADKAFNLQHLISNGKIVVKNSKLIVKGSYE